MGTDEEGRRLCQVWLQSEEHVKAKMNRLLCEGMMIIAGLDYKTDELCRQMRDYEARVLLFTSYPLGKGRGFIVDVDAAKK